MNDGMPRWLGFRLPARGLPPDRLTRFLVSADTCLEPWRWFYLWHSEGGLHLRIRIWARNTHAERRIRESMNTAALELGLGSPVCTEWYSRQAHGFGDTVESVLSELLHVATSKLALQILSRVQPPQEGRLWVAAACAVWSLARRGIHGDIAEYLDQALTFTQRVGRIGSRSNPLTGTDRRVEAVVRGTNAVEQFLSSKRSAAEASRLIAKLWSRGSRGQFVAVHGLHLFCNELGLSIQREYVVMRVLDHLRRERHG
jgi:hypothetical protein